ncbi:MAG TPA: baseplate J/gp47 family protein [Pseudoneobacillus sp.]|nr:baseplate J/gp47 family protein [Pseudoneobacillus sp.]
MYEAQTYEVILKRMLDNLPDTIDKREGSVAYDMLAPKAMELAMAYVELDNVLKYGFVDTTYGSFLDKKVSEGGVDRVQAQYAKGTVTFTGPGGTPIQQGTVVYTNNGIRFLTDIGNTIPGTTGTGSIDIAVTAETAGTSSNVTSGSIVNCSITGVTVNNTNVTTGGVDTEIDADLLERYLTRVRNPSTSGNIYDYHDWATSVIGIGDARIVPLWNGNGTVKVIVLGSDKKSVTSTKVQEVKDKIEAERPVGATVTVESAINKNINITATMTLQSGYLLADVQTQFKAALVDYFDSITFVDSTVKYSKIGATLLSTEGVVDYNNLLVNGATANITLANNEIPTVGTVTLS